MGPVVKSATFKWICGILLALAGAGTCKVAWAEQTSVPTFSRAQGLTQKEALIRSHQLKNIHYFLKLDLAKKEDLFLGQMKVSFDFRPDPKLLHHEISLDLKGARTAQGAQVSLLKLNGKKLVVRAHVDEYRIFFKPSELKAGSNTLEISYRHAYSESGMGLYRYKDPVDNETYLYTNLEPFSANEVFPCFDQPDLKARFELQVKAPAHWVVVSNSLELPPTRAQGGTKTWRFPSTPLLSTYLYALYAGPYQRWQAEAVTSHGKIPIRFFARKSLTVERTGEGPRHWFSLPEWVEVTTRGLEVFEQAFQTPYPFTKYDQIFVPEFGTSGMENAAATALTEDVLHRGLKPTTDELRRRHYLVLHEMVHMWFGNLVTMKWWNGLWLNEGFASFLAMWALEKTGISEEVAKGAWLYFHIELKGWAAGEDQLEIAHPVHVGVDSTNQARANFDAMTYGKGAAVVRQLFHAVGEEAFFRGVRLYFDRFRWTNAGTADLLRAFEEANHLPARSLTSDWSKQWLKTRGINTLAAHFSCENGKITRAWLEQGNGAGSEQLRSHRTRVAFYKFPALQVTGVKPSAILDVSYSQAITEMNEARGWACPDWIFPNDQDLDYTKVLLDTPSQFVLFEHLSQIADPLTRLVVWGALWEQLLAGQVNLQVYSEFAFKYLVSGSGSDEKDTQILNEFVASLGSASLRRQSLLKFMSPGASGLREAYWKRLDQSLRDKLLKQAEGSVEQAFWLNPFLEVANSAESQALVLGLIEGRAPTGPLNGILDKLKREPERRWSLITSLARAGHPAARHWIEKEKELQQRSEFAMKSAAAAEASLPLKETKAKWLAHSLTLSRLPLSSADAKANPGESETPKLPSIAEREAAAEIYHTVGQEEYTRAAVDPFFKSVLEWDATKMDLEEFSYYVDWMFPALCDSEVTQKTTSVLERAQGFPPEVIKTLRTQRQENERCMKARGQ